jgi:tetratricopeptide (TPR) repeat protein
MNWIESLLSALRTPAGPQAAANVPDLMAGVTAKRAGQTAEALAAFGRAYERPTTQTEQLMIVRLMTETHLATRQFDAARALTEKHPPQGYVGSAAAHAWLSVGMLADATGDITAAGDAFAKAVKACREAGNSPLEGLALAWSAAIDLKAGSAGYAVKVLREALPKMLNVGEQENSAYFQGVLGQALIATGQENTGAGLIGQALETAVRLNDVERIRLWSLVLAERAFSDSRHFDADTHLSRALPLFGEDDAGEQHVRALTLRALNDLAQNDTSRALVSAERACALSAANDDLTSGIRSAAHEARALALKAAGRAEEAVTEFAALAAEDALSPRARRQYAAALADAGHTAEALAVLEALRAAGAGTLEEALAWRDIGLVHKRAGQTTQALQAWAAAVPLCEAHNAWATAARVLCEMSLARRATGQTARALKDIDAALMLLTKLGEHEIETRGVVLSHAATAYTDTGDVESTDAFYTEAISIAARLGDRAAESTRLGNYGWFLMQIGRPRSAVVKLERALELGEGLDNPVQRGVHFDSLGSAFDLLNDFAAGHKYHEDAAALLEASGAHRWLALCRANWAMTCLSLGETDRARELLGQALEAGQTHDFPDVRVKAGMGQAALALREKQPDAARTAALVAEARTLEDRRMLADVLAVHSQTLAETGDAAGARAAWDEAGRLFTMMHMPQARISPAWLSGQADTPEPRPSDQA